MALILEFKRHLDLCRVVGKLDNLCVRPDGLIYDKSTGEVVSVVKYPYEKWTKDYFESRGYKMIFPMKAYPNVSVNLDKDDGVIQHKLDGTSSRCYITRKGLRFFGPRIVDLTGWVGEYTDKVIHLRDLKLPEFAGTILDGEFVHPSGIMPDRISASILNPRTKYETSWAKQVKDGWLIYVAYDVIRYKGIDVTRFPYRVRLQLLDKIMYDEEGLPHHECFFPIYSVPKNGATIDGMWFSQRSYHQYILDNKMEGTIWCDLNGRYEIGKRTKAKVKFKMINTYDVVIIGFDPPTKEVDFTKAKTSPEDWPYWYDEKTKKNIPVGKKPTKTSVAVTKFFYYGWVGSVIFGVYHKGKLVEVGKCSGMDEQVRQVLSDPKDERLKKFRGNKEAIGSVIEVEGQLYDSGESIRWPQFVRFRPDKDAKECTLDALRREKRAS